MATSTQINFPSKEVKNVLKYLERVKVALDNILEARGYGEWSPSEGINVPNLVKLQDTLKHELNLHSQYHVSFIVSRFAWDPVHEWSNWIAKSLSETSSINLEVDEKLINNETFRAVKRVETWLEMIRRTESERGVFLSYSSSDEKAANQIVEAIESIGGKVYISSKSLNVGEDYVDEIRQAIYESREMWLLLSPNSLKSNWVISEWGAAWGIQKKIIPILYECELNDMPDQLRRLHYVRFDDFNDLVNKTFLRK